MKDYSLYIIDLDGTMYKGSEEIKEAPLFIQFLQNKGKDFVFLTNNSSKTPREASNHLSSFGIQANEKQIYTTSIATAQYIKSRKVGARTYMIGGKGLREALREAGCQVIEAGEEDATHCDFMVIGLDRGITYHKLAQATIAVRDGAEFISTNKDKALPTERGLLPGNGALTSVISTATGVDPLFIGKPEPMMIDLILREKGLQKEDALIIGDNYETDIMAGINAGIDTAIVYTGFTSPQTVEVMDIKPTYQWQTLLEGQEDMVSRR